MTKDTRKKACPNENCEMYHNYKYDVTDLYCKKCGNELVLVCAASGCYKKLDDEGPEHRICAGCSAKRDDRKVKVIKTGERVVSTVLTTGGAVAVAGAKLAKDVATSDEVRKVVNKTAGKAMEKAAGKLINKMK
jgi:hypothetical protein